MIEEKPIGFVLGIRPQFIGPNDTVLCYKVHAESKNLPKEIKKLPENSLSHAQAAGYYASFLLRDRQFLSFILGTSNRSKLRGWDPK